MPPQISVIIPCYNARTYLAECLEAIGQQTLRPHEVLVVDDASPEPIDEIVEEFAQRPDYPRIRLIRHESNRGQAAGRNTGIAAATGELLAFIDHDDIWAPDHLKCSVAALGENNLDMVFCPAALFYRDINEPGKYVMRPMTVEESELQPLALLERCFIIMSSVVIRSDAIREVGGFDESESMRAVEDLDLFMKLLKLGARLGMSETSTLFYRKHPESATCREGHIARQLVHVTERHLNWPAGSVSKKRRILVVVRWRAATQLYAIKADDRKKWLFMALSGSIASPYLMSKHVYKFARFIIRR